MKEKRCKQCSKALPAHHVGELCELCAVGLWPADPVESEPAYQTGVIVEGRQLSGEFCPNCHAELTLADLSLKSCAICGATISSRPGQSSRSKRRAELQAARQARKEHEERPWPEDAPIW